MYIETDPNVDALNAIGTLGGLVTGRATILAGQSVATVLLAPQGQRDFSLLPVIVAPNQAAFDATANRFVGSLSADGKTLTITSNANATANTVVAYFIDAR